MTFFHFAYSSLVKAAPSARLVPRAVRPNLANDALSSLSCNALLMAPLSLASTSGGVPAVLESARLRVEPDCVRLEVAAAARAPDSEVGSDRLKLLASAIGVKRSEVVDLDAPP